VSARLEDQAAVGASQQKGDAKATRTIVGSAEDQLGWVVVCSQPLERASRSCRRSAASAAGGGTEHHEHGKRAET